MKTKIILTTQLILLLTVYSFAQVKVDGNINDKEYQSVYEVSKNMKIFITTTEKEVFVGLESSAKGWFAVGFGSPVMNNSIMFL